MRCIAWGARLLVIGFTGGIGLARTNLLLIKGASVLGVRAGEAVRRNPALGEVQAEGAAGMGGEPGKSGPTSRIACRWKIMRRRCGSWSTARRSAAWR